MDKATDAFTEVANLFSLRGKLAVVTGGQRGIGRAIAAGYRAAGAKIAILDLTCEPPDGTANVSAYQCNVADENSVEEAIANVLREHGQIDILVNNAGINVLGPAATYPTVSWQKVLDINLTGAFFCARRVGEELIRTGRPGRIINIASVMGHVGPMVHSAVAYGAAKAGMLGLTRALAVEWAKHRINVNAICPGMILTELTASRMNDENYKRGMRQRIPTGQFGSPDDLVGAAIYLASPASQLVTGHALNVDGGWMAA
ncbi:MAG: SDR family oxidoreductase [Methylobacteriaceae bacterium]|nr:SDR family oxidoreductase [Methylobacteriaceae bacterium]